MSDPGTLCSSCELCSTCLLLSRGRLCRSALFKLESNSVSWVAGAGVAPACQRTERGRSHRGGQRKSRDRGFGELRELSTEARKTAPRLSFASCGEAWAEGGGCGWMGMPLGCADRPRGASLSIPLPQVTSFQKDSDSVACIRKTRHSADHSITARLLDDASASHSFVFPKSFFFLYCCF